METQRLFLISFLSYPNLLTAWRQCGVEVRCVGSRVRLNPSLVLPSVIPGELFSFSGSQFFTCEIGVIVYTLGLT